MAPTIAKILATNTPAPPPATVTLMPPDITTSAQTTTTMTTTTKVMTTTTAKLVFVIPTPKPTPTSNIDAGRTNLTLAILTCPPPLLLNVNNLTSTSCEGDCCIPCPASIIFYKPGQMERVYTITCIFRAISAVACGFLAAAYWILPSKRKHPHVIVLLFATATVPWEGLGTAWLFKREQLLCKSIYEIATMTNSWLCAIQVLGTLCLGFLLILNLHVMTIYRSSLIQRNMSRLLVLAALAPLASVVPVAVKRQIMNPGFGSICFTGPAIADHFFFIPMSVIVVMAIILHLGTIAFLIKNSIQANVSVIDSPTRGIANPNMPTTRQRRLQTARDISMLLRQQWRPGLFALCLLIIDGIYWLFYFQDAKKVINVTPQTPWFKIWEKCLTQQTNISIESGILSLKNPTLDQIQAAGIEAQKVCAAVAAPFIPNFIWAALTDIVPAMFGLIVFAIFGSRMELWFDVRVRLFGRRGLRNSKPRFEIDNYVSNGYAFKNGSFAVNGSSYNGSTRSYGRGRDEDSIKYVMAEITKENQEKLALFQQEREQQALRENKQPQPPPRPRHNFDEYVGGGGPVQTPASTLYNSQRTSTPVFGGSIPRKSLARNASVESREPNTALSKNMTTDSWSPIESNLAVPAPAAYRLYTPEPWKPINLSDNSQTNSRSGTPQNQSHLNSADNSRVGTPLNGSNEYVPIPQLRIDTKNVNPPSPRHSRSQSQQTLVQVSPAGDRNFYNAVDIEGFPRSLTTPPPPSYKPNSAGVGSFSSGSPLKYSNSNGSSGGRGSFSAGGPLKHSGSGGSSRSVMNNSNNNNSPLSTSPLSKIDYIPNTSYKSPDVDSFSAGGPLKYSGSGGSSRTVMNNNNNYNNNNSPVAISPLSKIEYIPHTSYKSPDVDPQLAVVGEASRVQLNYQVGSGSRQPPLEQQQQLVSPQRSKPVVLPFEQRNTNTTANLMDRPPQNRRRLS
ncbi:hypothetical protein BGZ98_006009 [Dissophora globulifera]|nr:hypothetical protein BGZ98_006009 [Dissophora globulifera]